MRIITIVGARSAGVALLVLACARERPSTDSALPDSPAAVADTGARTLTPSVSAPAETSCIVTDSSMGPVRLGMTLAEAKQVLPGASFERGFDGDGVASVNVVVARDSIMSLVADGDEDETIDVTRPIVFMETFSRSCRTADGVHPGALVADVERILGKVTRITLSEIESRQFVQFARQSGELNFRLDYTGIFADGARETQRFEPEAEIFSIAIASP